MCCRVRRSAPVRTTYSRCASTGQLLLGTGAPESMTVVGVHTQERTVRQTVAIGLRFAESRRIIPSDSAIKTQNGNVTPSPYAEKNARSRCPAPRARARGFFIFPRRCAD